MQKNRENEFYGNNTKFFTSKMRPYQSQTQKSARNREKSSEN